MLLKIVVTLFCITSVFSDIIHIRKHVKIGRPGHYHRIHSHHKHKKGFSLIPPYKAGYDIPVVSHSYIKPLLVQYPTKSVPIGVKIPLKHPLEGKYLPPVEHEAQEHHTGHGINIPGWSKPLVIPVPTQLHHHHVLKPVLPHIVPTVPAASVPIPVPAPLPPPTPTVPLVPAPTQFHFRPILPSPPLVVHQAPLVPVQPAPPPVHIPHTHFYPINPPLHPAPVPVVPQSASFPVVIRPGNAVQQSVFATYPRYNFVQPNLIPVAHHLRPLFLGRPGLVPQPFFIPQNQIPSHVLPDAHPPQLVPNNAEFHPGVVQPEHPPHHAHQESFPPYQPHNPITYSQEQHIPVFENTGENQDFNAHFQHQQNIQQQQYEHDQHLLQQQFAEQHHLHQQQLDHQQHHFEQNQFQHQQHELQQFHNQQAHDLHQFQQQQLDQGHQQDLHHQQFNQEQFIHNQQHNLEQAQYDQPFHSHAREEYGPPQQEYGPPPQNYGLPQHQERSDNSSTENTQNEEEQEEAKYENHIPLKQKLPLETPPEKF